MTQWLKKKREIYRRGWRRRTRVAAPDGRVPTTAAANRSAASETVADERCRRRAENDERGGWREKWRGDEDGGRQEEKEGEVVMVGRRA